MGASEGVTHPKSRLAILSINSFNPRWSLRGKKKNSVKKTKKWQMNKIYMFVPLVRGSLVILEVQLVPGNLERRHCPVKQQTVSTESDSFECKLCDLRRTFSPLRPRAPSLPGLPATPGGP